MESIVKYRFDREMVSFVKTLDIKTAMFGYDKGDVYSKIKDLLVKARDVCEELVREAYADLESKQGEALLAAAPEGSEAVGDAGLILPESPAVEIEQVPETEGDELSRLHQENQQLREKLEEFAAREELLKRAHDIVTEARLEREAIIRKAQTKAEEELFLYRAKQREEDAAAREELKRLDAKKQEVGRLCDGYRNYVEEGEDLFEQLRAYAAKLDQVVEKEVEEQPESVTPDFNPPVLSPDESLSCTEESMPLCEIVDEDPEGIYRGQDLSDDPASYNNKPEEEAHEETCREELL